MLERHERILQLVAETYVETARPVSSAAIARELEISSATVRNAFAALDEAGLLQQPHASAGRIPTNRGFGQYTRWLIPPTPMPLDRVAALRHQFAQTTGDSRVQTLADVVAALTGYAVVVTLPAHENLHALEIHLTALHSRALMAVVVLESGIVRQLRVDLDPSPEEGVLNDAERALRQLTLPVAAVPQALQALAQGAEPELARTLLAIKEAWPHVLPTHAASAGLTAVLREPEAADPAFVRLLVERVANPSDAMHAGNLTESASSDGLDVRWNETLATVHARWQAGAAEGQLMLVGPARLRYRPALQVVHGAARAISAVEG